MGKATPSSESHILNFWVCARCKCCPFSSHLKIVQEKSDSGHGDLNPGHKRS